MLVSSEVGDQNATSTQLSQRFENSEKTPVKQQSVDLKECNSCRDVVADATQISPSAKPR
ncbi:hypothetical protein ACTXT7_014636 [Hymenolepis weldensis]